MTLVLRAPVPGDVNLITRNYVRTGRYALDRGESMPPGDWDSIAERFVAACIEDGHCIVLGSPAESGASDKVPVAGYVLGTRSRSGGASRATLHWVYVSDLYRGRGYARTLAGALTNDATSVTVTHTTKSWQRAKARRLGWQHAPRAPWLWLLSRERPAA